uniref:Uncharacterized protein n=1 Tax=Cacopsylla melanoneura TaxID=428564 RepID=A0A8D8Z5N2_9HEMI
MVKQILSKFGISSKIVKFSEFYHENGQCDLHSILKRIKVSFENRKLFDCSLDFLFEYCQDLVFHILQTLNDRYINHTEGNARLKMFKFNLEGIPGSNPGWTIQKTRKFKFLRW